jgi:photosystem II stability/assembly factor-like uncharacterized protein
MWSQKSYIASVLALIAVSLGVGRLHAQWQMQESHSTASLRGIHSVDGSVAWATGMDGTILRTQDGGAHWQRCTPPTGAEKLDFRGVWGWSTYEARILASGPGDLSRAYATTDSCSHWIEEAGNAEKGGFWDALVFQRQYPGLIGSDPGVLLGDPVKGRFETINVVPDRGWSIEEKACTPREGEAAFAASNSAVFVFDAQRYLIVTGGKPGPRALLSPLLANKNSRKAKECLAVELPLVGGTDSAGAFSVAFRDLKHGVVVGGDYKKPDDATSTAAWSDDGGRHWTAASKPPHGYRSAVAWYPEAKVWIAVGTNGSDFSHDDGQTWEHLDDGKWNAVSPPFAVGPGGRIGRLQLDKGKR